MPSKIGRWELRKKFAKDILIGARFDPAESKLVNDAVSRSGTSKSDWIRKTLLDAAKVGKPDEQTMKIKLSTQELDELNKTPPSAAKRGGFQNFMVQLQYRIDEDTNELDLDSTDLQRIQRYAFAYKQGGYQTRLQKIFARNLGSDLSGKLARNLAE
jgi:hypothetical protein